jgi:hypothetical protein
MEMLNLKKLKEEGGKEQSILCLGLKWVCSFGRFGR